MMGAKTGIAWTDSTWNPIRGCSRVSEGCRNCYAEKIAARFCDSGQPYEGVIANGRWNGKVKFAENHLIDPLKWKSLRRIFVNSMSDLFHESVTDEMRDRIFAVMALCPQHVFQVLTKRPERMWEYISSSERKLHIDGAIWEVMGHHPANKIEHGGNWRCTWPLSNVWLGVSVEDQAAADERIPLLLQTPAAVRFVSCEPLLGPVSLHADSPDGGWDYLKGLVWCEGRGTKETSALDWVICGGESGPQARPMHPDWVRSLRDQCSAAQVPFFFKQWGEWIPVRAYSNGEEWSDSEAIVNSYHGDIRGVEALSDETTWLLKRVGKQAAGCQLDGREWKQFPEAQR